MPDCFNSNQFIDKLKETGISESTGRRRLANLKQQGKVNLTNENRGEYQKINV